MNAQAVHPGSHAPSSCRTDSPDNRSAPAASSPAHLTLPPEPPSGDWDLPLDPLCAAATSPGQRAHVSQPRGMNLQRLLSQPRTRIPTTSPTACPVLCSPRKFRSTAVSKPVKKHKSHTIGPETLCDSGIWSQLLPHWQCLPASIRRRACESLAKVQLALPFSVSDLEELLHCTGDTWTCKSFLATAGSSPRSPSWSPRILTSCTDCTTSVCSKHKHVGLFSFTMTSQIFIHFSSFLSACSSQPTSLSELLFRPLVSPFHAAHYITLTTFYLLTQRLPGSSPVSLVFLATALSKSHLWFLLAGILEQDTGKVWRRKILCCEFLNQK